MSDHDDAESPPKFQSSIQPATEADLALKAKDHCSVLAFGPDLERFWVDAEFIQYHPEVESLDGVRWIPADAFVPYYKEVAERLRVGRDLCARPRGRDGEV